MTTFDTRGLVDGGYVGPQVLGHQGPRLVANYSHINRRFDAKTGTWVCPLDQIFTAARNPVIIFGTPNVSLIMPEGPGQSGWDRFAAFMFWRQQSYITDTHGRVQAGVFFELLGAPIEAQTALRWALQNLVGTRKASCAHSVALALHRAGFTAGNGKSLRRVYRPSQLASVLWRNDLRWRGTPIQLRIIQTHKSVPDHFVSVWKREYTSPVRLYRKYFAGHSNKRAPVFDATGESVELADWLWVGGPRVDIGVSIPSPTGVNLGFVFGEQPEFTVTLPCGLQDKPQLSTPLKPFPGKLNRVTKLKKYILFSRPVIWFMRKHLVNHIEWMNDVPVRAAANMLRRSPGPERSSAFVYNFVLLPDQLKLKRLRNDNGRDQKIVAWLLAKHVLLSGYAPRVLLAGEIWAYKDNGEIIVCLSTDSGTYKPDAGRGEAVVGPLSDIFQTKVILVERQNH